MSGRLGTANLTIAGGNTLVYTCPVDTLAILYINICNRTATPAEIDIALADSAIPSVEQWIEFGLTLNANSSFERKGIVLSSGQTVVAKSSIDNVSVQVWGLENGV